MSQLLRPGRASAPSCAAGARPLAQPSGLDESHARCHRPKQIPAAEIDAIRRQRLLQHKDETVRARRRRSSPRLPAPIARKVVDFYWVQLPDKADAGRGAEAVRQGLRDLPPVRRRGGQQRRAGPRVGRRQIAAGAAHRDPRSQSRGRGALHRLRRRDEARARPSPASSPSETSTNITLVGPDGKQHQLLRNELDELTSTGKSMMPEGLEKDLSPQDLADIIEFVAAT